MIVINMVDADHNYTRDSEAVSSTIIMFVSAFSGSNKIAGILISSINSKIIRHAQI